MTARIKSETRAFIIPTLSENSAPNVAIYDRPNQVRNRTDSIPKLLERALRTSNSLSKGQDTRNRASESGREGDRAPHPRAVVPRGLWPPCR